MLDLLPPQEELKQCLGTEELGRVLRSVCPFSLPRKGAFNLLA